MLTHPTTGARSGHDVSCSLIMARKRQKFHSPLIRVRLKRKLRSIPQASNSCELDVRYGFEEDTMRPTGRIVRLLIDGLAYAEASGSIHAFTFDKIACY